MKTIFPRGNILDPRIFFSDPIQTETVDPDPTLGLQGRKILPVASFLDVDINSF